MNDFEAWKKSVEARFETANNTIRGVVEILGLLSERATSQSEDISKIIDELLSLIKLVQSSLAEKG